MAASNGVAEPNGLARPNGATRAGEGVTWRPGMGPWSPLLYDDEAEVEPPVTSLEEELRMPANQDRIEQLIEAFARLDERLGATCDRLDAVVASTVSKSTVDDLIRRVTSLESDRAKLVWLVMAGVISAVLVSAGVLSK